MPKWFEKLLLPEHKLNILNVIESYDISRIHADAPHNEHVTYTAYSENDDKRIVKVRQSLPNKQPTDLIVWAMYIDTKTGETTTLNEANSVFAKIAMKRIYNKYAKQHVK
jgi:hypothetical protein